MKHRITALAALAFVAACADTPTSPAVDLEVAPAFSHVPGNPAAPNLSEDFNSGVWNPALEDHDNAFTLYNGHIQRSSFPSYEERRSYVRTVASGYSDSDFTAELLIQVGPRPTLIFFGLGAGEPVAPYNEPTGAFFRIHSPSWIGGRVDAAVTGGAFVEGFTHVQNMGFHKVRIIKSGNQLTFEFDNGGDGSVDGSATVAMPGTLDETNSRIYFGTSDFYTWFDDLSITAVPYPTNPTSKDDCKNGGWAQYGFRNQGLCIQYVNTGKDSR